MKILIAVVIATFTSFAFSQKVLLEGIDANFYVEMNTPTKERNISTVWVLADYKKVNEFKDLSHRKLTQFNCQTKQFRFIQSIYYQGHNGNGKVTATSQEATNWQFISPNSIIEGTFLEACKENKK